MHMFLAAADIRGSPGEAQVFRQAQAGCRNSLNRLMAEHDGLVQAVVRQQVLDQLPFAEALQAGRIGLWHAILRYDPERGLAFSTYAWPSITHQVWRAVAATQRFDRPPRTEGKATSLTAWLRAEPDPFTVWETAARRAAFYHLLARLPARLRSIVVARYGLRDDPPASFRQIGVSLGLSGERVHQLHTQALVWLRHPAHSQYLRSLLGRHSLADYQEAFAQAQAWRRQRRRRYGRPS